MEQQIDNGSKIRAKVMAIPKLPTIQPARIVNYVIFRKQRTSVLDGKLSEHSSAK